MKNLLIIVGILITAPSAFADASSTQLYLHSTYPDGTQSASSVKCDGLGCCKEFLEGLENGTWQSIKKLECIDENNKVKTYINGKEEVKASIKTTYGDNSPIVETSGEGNNVTVNNKGLVANLSIPEKSIIVFIVSAISILLRIIYKKLKLKKLRRK